MDVNYIVLSS